MKYTFGGFMALIRCDSSIISRYLYHVLTGDLFAKYLEHSLNSTTINNLNSTVMSGLDFPFFSSRSSAKSYGF